MTYWDKNERSIQPTGFACKLWDFLQRYEALLLLPFPAKAHILLCEEWQFLKSVDSFTDKQ